MYAIVKEDNQGLNALVLNGYNIAPIFFSEKEAWKVFHNVLDSKQKATFTVVPVSVTKA